MLRELAPRAAESEAPLFRRRYESLEPGTCNHFSARGLKELPHMTKCGEWDSNFKSESHTTRPASQRTYTPEAGVQIRQFRNGSRKMRVLPERNEPYGANPVL
jgi:hypothetical protein